MPEVSYHRIPDIFQRLCQRRIRLNARWVPPGAPIETHSHLMLPPIGKPNAIKGLGAGLRVSLGCLRRASD